MRSTRLYWACQAIGWGCFTLYTTTTYIAAVGRARVRGVDIASFIIFDAVLCPLATHGVRGWMRSHRWLELPLRTLAPRVIATAALVSATLTAMVVLGIAATRGGRFPPAESMLGIFIGFSLAMAGWFAIYFQVLARRRRQQLERQALELSIVARDAQLRALRSQLNPHFLFNSLNSLRGLIVEDPSRAVSMVTGFAGLMRYSLGSDRTDTVTLAEEMSAVDDYLELERVRFEERLQVQRALTPEALSARVPPMIVQLLVENAIKHGIANLREGGVVRIDAGLLDGSLQVRVSNTGVLSRNGDSPGVGLDNARERLRLLYGQAASLTLQAGDGPTVVACLSVPLAGLTA